MVLHAHATPAAEPTAVAQQRPQAHASAAARLAHATLARARVSAVRQVGAVEPQRRHAHHANVTLASSQGVPAAWRTSAVKRSKGTAAKQRDVGLPKRVVHAPLANATLAYSLVVHAASRTSAASKSRATAAAKKQSMRSMSTVRSTITEAEGDA